MRRLNQTALWIRYQYRDTVGYTGLGHMECTFAFFLLCDTIPFLNESGVCLGQVHFNYGAATHHCCGTTATMAYGSVLSSKDSHRLSVVYPYAPW